MASLYSHLRKLKVNYVETAPEIDKGQYDDLVSYLLEFARTPSCILVNINSVLNDVIRLDDGVRTSVNAPGYGSVTCATPPFLSMWLEGVLPSGGPIALQIIRYEKAAFGGKVYPFVVRIFEWVYGNGVLVSPPGRATFGLDELGRIEAYDHDIYGNGDIKTGRESIEASSWIALHVLMRMNCRNCELRSVAEGKARPHKPNKVTPACVWHEIKITSVPKIQTTGRNSLGAPDSEKRACWIRGHYADYRMGNGLFGNPKLKCVFWIPEHKKGNEDLGIVIPEYVIQ